MPPTAASGPAPGGPGTVTASASVAADQLQPEPSTTARVADLALRFTLEFPIVRVTDDDAKGRFVGNVYGFDLSGGPFIYASFSYRAQFGTSELDPHGAGARREICQIAGKFRDEGA